MIFGRKSDPHMIMMQEAIKRLDQDSQENRAFFLEEMKGMHAGFTKSIDRHAETNADIKEAINKMATAIQLRAQEAAQHQQGIKRAHDRVENIESRVVEVEKVIHSGQRMLLETKELAIKGAEESARNANKWAIAGGIVSFIILFAQVYPIAQAFLTTNGVS